MVEKCRVSRIKEQLKNLVTTTTFFEQKELQITSTTIQFSIHQFTFTFL